LIKIWQEWLALYMTTYTYVRKKYCWILLRMRSVSDKNMQKVKTRILCCTIFFWAFMRQCGKLWYSHTGHRRQYNQENKWFSCWITKARTQTNTLRIFNTYSFSMVTMVVNETHCYIICISPVLFTSYNYGIMNYRW
jgi:hypothetical protein